MEKDFNKWSELKQKLNNRKAVPTFKEREVWWCSIGANVGCEEDGKNQLFNRPILVVRKFNNNLFLAIPLSSQIKENRYYHKIHLQDKEGSVLLSQIRVLEGKRLNHKIATITKEQFEIVREKIRGVI